MEDKTHFIEPLIERVEEYANTSYEIFRLKAIDKTVDIVSTFFSRGAAILLFCLFIAMVNIGIAFWLGDILGKTYYGFFCVAAFYGVVGILLYFFMHKWLKRLIGNSMVYQIFN